MKVSFCWLVCYGMTLKLLVLFQAIMKDKWMNVGYEDEELKPYIEPEPDFSDTRRMGKQGELTLVLYSR